MRLIFDIGNSRLKWSSLLSSEVISAAILMKPIEHGGDIDGAFSEVQAELAHIRGGKKVDQISIGSVTENKGNVVTACMKYWEVKPSFLKAAKEAFGVTNSYSDPGVLGVDRWAAMIESYCLAGSAVCIFDLGSALTVDTIDSNGRHLGGFILPGMSLMREAVIGGTSQVIVDQTCFNNASPRWGRSTNAAVNNGILYAAITLIQNTIKTLRLELQMPVEAFLTGGDARLVLPFVNDLVRFDEHLVLKGLNRLSEYVN